MKIFNNIACELNWNSIQFNSIYTQLNLNNIEFNSNSTEKKCYAN
jgi:hypothetical protein